MSGLAWKKAASVMACSAFAGALHGVAHAQVVDFGGPRRMDIGVSASATYDSNVARGDSAVDGLRLLSGSDFIYEPAVTVDVNLPVGRESVFLNGRVGYSFYQRNSTLNAEDIALAGGGRLRAGPCGLTLNAGISRHQSDLADLSLVVTQNIQQTASAGATLQCFTPTGLGATVGYQYARTTNDSQFAQDSSLTGVTAGVVYVTEALGKLQLTGGYTKSDYDDINSGGLIIPGSAGYKQYDATVSIERAIGRRLSGSAALGYTREKSEDPALKDFKGLTGQGQLTYHVNPRLDAAVSYKRGLVNALEPGVDYILQRTARLDFTYKLSPRLDGRLGVSNDHRTYEGVSIAPLGLVTDDKLTSLFGGVTLKVGRRSSLTFNAQYDDRSANLPIFSYTGYRVGVVAATLF